MYYTHLGYRTSFGKNHAYYIQIFTVTYKAAPLDVCYAANVTKK